MADTREEINTNRTMAARVIDYDAGLREFNDVRGVRIISAKYNLLIMLDHTPLLGEVEGSVILVCTSGEYRFDNIKGFYKHSYNEFSLLLDTGHQRGFE